MNIKDLSLKKILGNDWTYNSEFQYEDFAGSAELHKGDRIILFRRKDKEDISAISFQAVGLCDKKLFHTVNNLLAEVGINLRMGDSRNKIVKKFGTPNYVDCIEEGYYRYLDYVCYYTETFIITRYHYLLAPDLLICFGMPKEHYQKLTDLEIVNDQQMVSSIMEKRTAYKDFGNGICPCKNRLSFTHQIVENRNIETIESEIVMFLESEIKNCNIEGVQSNELDFFELKISNCIIKGIQSEYVQFANCIFENVEFKNHYKKGYFSIEHCTFKNCIFHDTFGIGYLYVFDNQFQNCLFDGIKVEMETEGTYLASNNITDCIFQNIVWVGCGLCANTMSGGKIVHVSYNERNKIEENYFSDMQMEDMEVEMKDTLFFRNRFQSVTFKNVILKGQMEKNKFINCDTNSFTYIPLKSN